MYQSILIERNLSISYESFMLPWWKFCWPQPPFWIILFCRGRNQLNEVFVAPDAGVFVDAAAAEPGSAERLGHLPQKLNSSLTKFVSIEASNERLRCVFLCVSIRWAWFRLFFLYSSLRNLLLLGCLSLWPFFFVPLKNSGQWMMMFFFSQ